MPEISGFITLKSAVAFFQAAVFAYLFLLKRERYMGFWALAFAVMSLSLFLSYSGVVQRESLSIIVFRVVHFTLLLWGSCEFAGRGAMRPLKYAYLAMGGIVIASWQRLYLLLHITDTAFSDIYSGLARCIAAFLIAGSRLSIGRGKYIAGTAFMLSGFNLAFRPLKGVGNWGWILSVMLDFMVTFGLLMVHFEAGEEALVRHRDKLEEEVKARTRDLETARDEAVRANAMKDKLISLVSHDLRSPIASLSSCLRQLAEEKGYAKIGPDEMEETLQEMKMASDGVINTIDDLLSAGKVQAGTISVALKEVMLSDFADAAVARTKKGYLKKEVAIENRLGREKAVMADPVLLERLLHNLLGNALKFTGRGGAVSITESARGAAFAVADSGRGIAPHLLPDLFRHDVRTTTPGTEGEKGTGLGLPLCADIAAILGGRIEVESEEGQGSIFHVFLPKQGIEEASHA